MLLEGVRVVDLSRVISGPFCAALLADLGADVIKVEPLGQGDPVRQQGVMVGTMSTYFANYNRNKRSVMLDLYAEEGKAALADLLAGADVLVENFRPGVLARMGFARDRVKAVNPALILCSINGFGADGPYADRPAFDFIVQAMSGFMACNGRADEPAMRSGVPIADLVSGLYAALGVVASLHGGRTGARGSDTRPDVSVSMLASLMSMLSFQATNHLNSGAPAARTGNDHPLVAPYGLFATADGEIAIAPSNDAVYRKLVKALDLEAALSRPEFETNAQRLARRAEVNAIIDARMKTAPSAHWIEVLNRAGVPCGPVHDLEQAFADPQARSQHIAVERREGGHRLSMLGLPVMFDGSPRPVRMPAPQPGEHTQAVLQDIGYGAERLAALRRKGVI